MLVEELDAVVRIRVVAGADHHPQLGALGAGEIGHRWRGQGAEQQHIDTGRIEARLQGRLEHVARNAGVFANQDLGPGVVLLEHLPHRVGQHQHKIRGDRGLAHGAADAIGSKILSAHGVVSEIFFIIRPWRAQGYQALGWVARPPTP